MRDAKDSQDYSSWWENSFLMYECHNIWRNCSNCLFISNSWDNLSNNILTMLCVGWSNNLFWCIGLRNKQYCIFNKQYTKDEYEKTVANIITHMQETGERGEFFHPSLSPFGYNETVAQEYFPLEKIEDKRWAMNDNRLFFILLISMVWLFFWPKDSCMSNNTHLRSNS